MYVCGMCGLHVGARSVCVGMVCLIYIYMCAVVYVYVVRVRVCVRHVCVWVCV